ncbi:MAG: hypothetical protein M0011_12560 [Elusimicrobia bacterium]|nr:hypothetical protein [Elusimicrobiota bacterium]
MTTHAKTKENEADLEQLISDYGPSKYNDIVRAMQWARHLRRQEDSRGMTMADLIDRAMLDIVGGKITPDEIDAAVKKDMEIEEKLAAKRPDDAKRLRKDVKEEKPA